jgi:hypothetical protein
MGQYHIVVNLDKKEWIHPHRIGLGLKQGEQIGSFRATMGDIIYLLLAISNGRGGGDVPTEGIEDVLGSWAGDRVLVVGDYSEPGDIDIPGIEHPYEDLYLQAQEAADWTEISPKVKPMIEKCWGVRIDDSGGWASREWVNKNAYLA